MVCEKRPHFPQALEIIGRNDLPAGPRDERGERPDAHARM
jgi:hypothetical protein